MYFLSCESTKFKFKSIWHRNFPTNQHLQAGPTRIGMRHKVITMITELKKKFLKKIFGYLARCKEKFCI